MKSEKKGKGGGMDKFNEGHWQQKLDSLGGSS